MRTATSEAFILPRIQRLVKRENNFQTGLAFAYLFGYYSRMNAAKIVKAKRAARKRLRENVRRALTAFLRKYPQNLESLGVSLQLNKTAAKRLLDGTQTPEAITVQLVAELCETTFAKLVNGRAK